MYFHFLFVIFLLERVVVLVKSENYDFINLPKDHLPIYFRTFPHLAQKCLVDPDCKYQAYLKKLQSKACWGYERGCKMENRFSNPVCPGDHIGYVKDKETQLDTFYHQADFGFVKEQIDEIQVLCEPRFVQDSSLECSKYLRFCRGRNIMVNFTDLIHRKEPLRYKMDILKQGQIGGFCKLDEKKLKDEIEHVSPLQSWAPELRFFEALEKRPIADGLCDIVVEKPTFLMKIDATINMYHHFCDFLNLYASLHVNMTQPHAFDTDVNILVWESYTYESPFEETFNAFTQNSIWDLRTFEGKTVCFKNLVLPLLPRMIFGLYYNTPIINGCENSGLFHAFAEHVLYRLRIRDKNRNGDKRLRVTFLSRQTKYRKVLNENALISEISREDKYIVNRVDYGGGLSFKEQLRITRNSDIMIGMHGAGLTHLLFLPKWGALFELYNCEDPMCYQDLARLRGVYYLTWEDSSKVYPQDEGHHPDVGRHAKFTNYAFDAKEFSRLVDKAAEHVRKHKEFQKFISKPSVIKHSEL